MRQLSLGDVFARAPPKANGKRKRGPGTIKPNPECEKAPCLFVDLFCGMHCGALQAVLEVVLALDLDGDKVESLRVCSV